MSTIDTVARLLRPGGLRFGEPQTAGTLTVVPIHHQGMVADYRLFADAVGPEVYVEETSTAGNVPELRVVNGSPHPVLLVEGEVLVGLKQNRTLNTTVLVPARETVVIPVSCVEAGRWGTATARAAKDTYHLSPHIRGAKNRAVQDSVRTGRGYRSDQSEVWRQVSDRLERHDAPSPTSSYSEVNRRRRPDIERLVAGLSPEPGAAGVLALIGRRPVAVDLFDRADTLRALWEPLVGSYAADALVEGRPAEERHVKEACDWVHDLAGGEAAEHPAVGAGTVVQLSSHRGIASALVVGGAVVHLAGLPGAARAGRPDLRIRRPSRRGNWFEGGAE